jgi:glycosyltransferase involved in cell wall biosynthesis
MDYNVIMPTVDRIDTAIIALKSVQAQSVKPSKVIIIAMGNDEYNVSLKLCIEKMRIRATIVKSSLVSPGRARNLGSTYATSNILLFIDDDDRWKPWHAEVISKHIKDYDFLTTSSMGAYKSGNISLFYVAPYYNLRGYFWCVGSKAVQKFRYTGFNGNTSALAIRKTAFDAVSGFDESLRYGEDRAMIEKLYKAKLTGGFVHCTTSVVFSAPSISRASLTSIYHMQAKVKLKANVLHTFQTIICMTRAFLSIQALISMIYAETGTFLGLKYKLIIRR